MRESRSLAVRTRLEEVLGKANLEVEVEVEYRLGDWGNGKAPETGKESQMKELYRVRPSQSLCPRVMRRGP